MSQTPRPRVVVTRSRAQSSALADQLRSLGAVPVLLPLITVAPPDSFAALDRALVALCSFDWLVFTSSNAVEATADRAALLGIGLQQETRQVRIAAIGSATVKALAARGLSCNLTPPEAISESLASALEPFALATSGKRTRFLLPRAQDARDIVPGMLARAGAEVELAAAYRNIVPAEAPGELRRLLVGGGSPPDAIAFTSSSTVRHLFSLLEELGLRLPDSVRRVSIGPVTSATLRGLGFPPHAEAAAASVASLASATLDVLRSAPRP